MMKAVPRAAFEVAEPQFLFELLVSLLARPSGLDGGGNGADACAHGVVAQVVFDLAVAASLADQPGLLTG